ncbi:ABC transporter substrate-binding protein [Piscinibacter sp.]|uniref:ABC transporter substrate-binding protein n=1 Tax=Piscinibacter sp. TaxID=1903157 RepID=UPI002CF5D5A1|nr:ABC transporter substrate binding protein [Albitalea sp.]HUG21114.1 ABC transporter substrate binding protein [Albitalea sp.]
MPASVSRRASLVWFASMGALWPALAPGADGARPIAVIYPEIGEPFRSVFAHIIAGIEQQARGRVASFAVGAHANAQELAVELKRLEIRVVIALGRNGLKTANALGRDVGLIVGGVLSVPESGARGLTVHSLAPDPALLFGQLKDLLPGARRVLVAYDARQNAWLIRRAREAATSYGLEIVAEEAADLKSAIRFYQQSFAAADARRDVLWLPQDSTTVDESAVLPLVLQEAWDRSVAVFSSSVAHVRRGALFSLYPDNTALGRSLAVSALSALAPGAPVQQGVLPLRDVLVAVNVRTANHLGISLAARRQQFDLIFPEP